MAQVMWRIKSLAAWATFAKPPPLLPFPGFSSTLAEIGRISYPAGSRGDAAPGGVAANEAFVFRFQLLLAQGAFSSLAQPPSGALNNKRASDNLGQPTRRT